jgi:hypothetical protein
VQAFDRIGGIVSNDQQHPAWAQGRGGVDERGSALVNGHLQVHRHYQVDGVARRDPRHEVRLHPLHIDAWGVRHALPLGQPVR